MFSHIKSHKKPGFYSLFRRYIFGKTTGGGEVGGRWGSNRLQNDASFVFLYQTLTLPAAKFVLLR